jgi:hypothetical protein
MTIQGAQISWAKMTSPRGQANSTGMPFDQSNLSLCKDRHLYKESNLKNIKSTLKFCAFGLYPVVERPTHVTMVVGLNPATATEREREKKILRKMHYLP